MIPEYSETKNLTNIHKHGLSFEMVATISLQMIVTISMDPVQRKGKTNYMRAEGRDYVFKQTTY